MLLVSDMVIGGLSEDNVMIANHTGLAIARIEIGKRKYEGPTAGGNVSEKILITVTPEKHHLKVIFRGGADVEWSNFDFRGVHEIIFEREHNKINAHVL
jgi:hypothetical protein